jgi:leucyl/phenylalanyl-tRNA--protein transferase
VIFRLDTQRPDAAFPDVELAEQEPDGLLAVGGDLSPARLINAYRQGIFPWYNPGQPILWWAPDPRTVLFPAHLKVSRSLRKTLRRQRMQTSLDQAFRDVVQACGEPRRDQAGTWILPEMMEAYTRLHHLGLAHSVEVWQGEALVGGLYGVAMGRVFFGESMFSRISDASKVALVHLVNRLSDWDYRLIDCQVYSEHLTTLGAEPISRRRFSRLLAHWLPQPPAQDAWRDRSRGWPQPPAQIQREARP